MRLAFLILLLANVFLFIWGQGYLGAQDAGREPARMTQQLAPEKLHIVAPEALQPVAEQLAE